MPKLNDLSREYEARRYPPTRRLDLQAEGPQSARERALRWIQSFAHEEPGAELLLVVERGRRPGSTPGMVRRAIESLLDTLEGGLIDGWQELTPGSIALRVSLEPHLARRSPSAVHDPADEGRTPETAGVALLDPELDVPPELLPLARRAAELRRMREGLSLGLLDVVLRRVWIEAQAAAMAERIGFDAALLRLVREEERQAYEEAD